MQYINRIAIMVNQRNRIVNEINAKAVIFNIPNSFLSAGKGICCFI